MPNATYLRYVGVARELGRTTLSAAVAGGGTSLPINTAQGTFATVSKITIYDGVNTEVVTSSAVTGTAITVGALAHAHPAGCLVTTVGASSAGPTDFIPVTKFDPFDNVTMLDDNGWRGSVTGPFNVVPGVRHGEIDVSGDVFPDTFGYWIGGVLGDVTFTGGTPNTHAVSLKNSGTSQPPTWQLTDVYLPGAGSPTVRQYGGCVISEVTTKFTADGMLSYDAKATGYASGTVATPTAAFSALVPLPAYTGVSTVAGTVTPLIVDGQISIKRASVDPIHNLDGSQDPYSVWSGMLNVDGNLVVIAEDETFLNYYLNNTQPSLDLNFSTGSGASLLGVKFHLTKAAAENGKPDASKAHLQYTLDFKGVANTTDAGASGGFSPVKVTLSNAKPTGTYA